MSFTSDDVNLLIHRYLQESGYRHSLFVFQSETSVSKTQAVHLADEVKPGALVHTLQKGLQMLILEAHVGEDRPNLGCRAPFSILTPHLHKCEHTPSKRSKRRKWDALNLDGVVERRSRSRASASVAGSSSSGREMGRQKAKERTKGRDGERARQRVREREKRRREAARKAEMASISSSRNALEEDSDIDMADRGAPPSPLSDAAAAKDSAGSERERKAELNCRGVLVLRGHRKEVFSCAWNPMDSTELASGSGDATGRLWKMPPNSSYSKEEDLCVLHHLPAFEETKDVTTMEWNASGTLLASGTYDGQVRIWTSMTNTDSPDASPGALRHVLHGHQGPIFALKWNKKGNILLSAGVDCSVFLWDTTTGVVIQQFFVHNGTVMDADWRDDSTFATASSDGDVAVCEVGKQGALKYFKGHKSEVNAVRWDPSGRYVASCSDDGTAKVWTLDSDEPVVTLSHDKEVFTLRWKPVKSGPEGTLATASFDHTVRLWDVPRGELVRTLSNHADTVYALEFDRWGRRLATGGLDGCLAVWDMETGTAVARGFAAPGGSVFDVSWNAEGDRVAAAASDHTVIVLETPS